jgi:putative ABC transport system permease protein
MRLLNRVWNFFRDLLHREDDDQDLDAEVRAHAEMLADEKMRQGMTAQEALRAARIEIGGIEQVKEEVRSARPGVWLETLRQDARFGVRMLRKNPGFTVVAVLTLALGIGANTAIFAVAYGVLWRPLPFPEPDRIVQLAESYKGATDEMDVTFKQLEDLRQYNQPFEQIAGYSDAGFNLATESQAEHVRGMPASANYFAVLGVRPTLGRDFLSEEDQGDGRHVVILSHSLWVRRFGGDTGVVGKSVSLNGESYAVIGVMPAHFDPRANSDLSHDLPVDLWIPLALVAKTAGSGENIAVIARLRRDVTLAQLRSQMDIITRNFRVTYPGDVGPRSAMSFEPYQNMLGLGVRPFLFVLLGAIGFVLLIACANVANLLLARGAGRGREIAVRMAVGASRGRLIRQLLTESVLIALAGGSLGWLLTSAGMRSLLALAPANLPRVSDIRLDAWVFGFTFLVAVLAGALFGIAPALYTTKANLNDSLKEGGSRSSASAGRARLRQGLVVGEIALSLVLLTGAGLMIATFAKLMTTNPGFDSRRILTLEFWLIGSKYNSTPEIVNFNNAVEQRIGSLPGVEAVGMVAAGLPLERGGNNGVKIPGAEQSGWLSADYREISPGYFNALGIPLERGRVFTDADSGASTPVVVINESFARRYFANRDPLGQHVYLGHVLCEVVGVVGDVKSYVDRPAQPTTFIPAAQALYGASRLFEGWFPRSIVVRTNGNPVTLALTVRDAVVAADPLVPIGPIRTMDQVRAHSQALRSFLMLLLSIFGALALVLASVGIYGVISYAVSQRTREIGVRMALGARTADVMKMVLRDGLKIVIAGIVFGVVAALALTRLLAGLVFGVSMSDPLIFILVVLLMAAVALLACYIPARRATKVDPMVALRYE